MVVAFTNNKYLQLLKNEATKSKILNYFLALLKKINTIGNKNILTYSLCISIYFLHKGYNKF